ncbi:MAG TPA: hypothetical protein VFA29_04530 [Candidatus Baltobacteraceae bacterium]|nr:hypothetical protein [Candidatus Baltobacteraceae bacterium]
MRSLFGSALCPIFALCLWSNAGAVSTGTGIVSVRAPHPLVADPLMRDPAWASGEVQTGVFWNLTKRRPAQFRTRVYLLYDDRHLYVGFHAEQPGVPVLAGQTTNNLGFGLDDLVGVAIDTGADGNHVYFFETTPGGVRYQQSLENVRYSARWESAARVDGPSWNAVLIVPLDVMRIPPGSHRTWRINFIRSIAALGEHYTWAYDGLMLDAPAGQGWPAFGDARFWPSIALDRLRAPDPFRLKPRVEIYGLASAGGDRSQFQLANGTFGPQSARPLGVDFTIPVTSTINAVGTLNPDFSNVEVDQQTIAPQEFARQLQEYRPFFAQGANFLSPGLGFSSPTSPNNVIFYSPRIGPFDRGGKIEGTFGLQSFGVLSVRGFDQTTGNTFDDLAYGYEHRLPDRSFYYWANGVLAHHSIAGDDSTADIGVSGQNLKSGFTWGTSQTLERGSWIPFTGAAHASLQYVAVNKPNLQAAVGYNDLSPNYNPIDGLTFNSDIHGFQGFFQPSGSARWAKNYSFMLNVDRWFDRSGAIHEADVLAQVSAVFNNGFSINALGPSASILRSYDVPANPDCTGPSSGTTFFTGYPCYRNGYDRRFNLFQSAFGYKDGTPRPLDVSFAFGPFGDSDVHVFSLTTSRPLGHYSVGLEYDGTWERSLATGVLTSQWLRRISLNESLGHESNLSLSIRSINGLGGFAPQTGTNLAIGYHRRFTSGNELFADYGTPSAYSTLRRFIVKYVLRTGGDAGT